MVEEGRRKLSEIKAHLGMHGSLVLVSDVCFLHFTTI